MGTRYQKQQSRPELLVKEIKDTYLRKNFENLSRYFEEQNQLLNFKFYDLKFTEADSDFSFDHGLGTIPNDIIVTKIVGSGEVTFKHGKFTSSEMFLSVSGPCRIRFFAGTYWNDDADPSEDEAEETTYTANPGGSSIPTGVILPFYGTVLPSGYLWCFGDEYKSDDYQNLATFLGVTTRTFRTPDLRGRFLRGLDNGSGRDPNVGDRTAMEADGKNSGNNVGSLQEDAMQILTGSFAFTDDNDTSFYVRVRTANVSGCFSSENLNENKVNSNGVPGATNAPGIVTFDNSRQARTSTENRPKNVAVNYIIKT